MIGTVQLPTYQRLGPLDAGAAPELDVPEQFNRAFVYLGI